MKKSILVLACACLLGCASKQPSLPSETSKEITTPISKTDFSETEAENVFNMAVRNHCRVTKQVCTVGKVDVQNNTIYGTYTYTENEQDYTVSGTLENVSISKNDSSIVTIGKKLFSTGIIKQKEDTSSSETEKTTNDKHFDLPLEADESKNGEVIFEDDVYKIRLMNLQTGKMNFNGTFDGTGYFKLYALTLDQSNTTMIAELEGSGEYNETTSLDAGWYYIVVERVDGTYTMNWAGQ